MVICNYTIALTIVKIWLGHWVSSGHPLLELGRHVEASFVGTLWVA